METTLPPSSGTSADRPHGIDEIIDLTDRRRVLLHLVFGVTLPSPVVDHVFHQTAAPVTPG